MGQAVGIDLGTTNSAVAWVDPSGTPAILPNDLGEPITPSVVCFRGGRTCVGREAKELQAAGEPGAVAFFKRQMGRPEFVFHAEGRDHSATDLSALILDKLRRDAQRALGQPVTAAVITVPAYFHHPERAATQAAGRAAGLDVLQVINEPTAAALAYGLRRGRPDRRLILVYDLGGGTFDVTLLETGPEEIRVLTSTGDHELGGKDWDDRIVQFAADAFRQEFGADPLADAASVSDLLVRSEEAKKRLSSAHAARIAITHDGRTGRYELTRAAFEQITADLVQRTVSLSREVLEEQGVGPDQLDGILLVGGSTRMPMVQDVLTRTFGRPPLGGVNVDEAVALGAAVVAAGAAQAHAPGAPRLGLAGRVRAVDVTNHSLGMIALNADGSAYINSPILPKNRPIPCTEFRPYQFRTRRGGDNHVEIFMTQGETQSPADVTYLGKYVLHDVPHREGGPAVIDIAYSYDVSGTVAVAGRLRDSDAALRLTVEPLPADVPGRFLRPPERATTAAPEHLTVYLAFDLSASMADAPLAEAQKAARGFLSHLDLARTSLGIIKVADRVAVELEACQDARRIEKAIGRLKVGSVGYGNTGQPFTKALELLRAAPGARFLVVLADGVWAHQDLAVGCAQDCHRAGIDVIAVGFGAADREFLREIASADEASLFVDLGGLVPAFSHIAQVLTEAGGGRMIRRLRPEGAP